MIYLLLGGICTVLGAGNAVGAATLLRPLLDAVSPLDSASVSLLCTAAALGAALIAAFFALSQPIPLHQDELLFLSIGALLGGVLGDLIGARFFIALPERWIVAHSGITKPDMSSDTPFLRVCSSVTGIVAAED